VFYTIYKTTNKLNGKIYIGKHQTKDLNDGYMGSGKYLKHAIEKHGIENFTKEILFVFENEADMNDREAELVTDAFVKEDTNYNLCPGGNGGFGYINENSLRNTQKQRDAARKNISKNVNHAKSTATMMQRKTGFCGEYERYKHKDYVHNGEVRQTISERRKGKGKGSSNSQYGTTWIWHIDYGNKKVKKEEVDGYIHQGWTKTYKPGYRVKQ